MIVFNPELHKPVQDSAAERMALIRSAEDIVSILDAGKKEKEAGTLAAKLLAVIVTLHPDRLTYQEEQRAIKESGKKGLGMSDEIPRFLGIQFDALPVDVQALCKNRTAQAQYSQAKTAYLGFDKPKPNQILAVKGILAKMDAATLLDCLYAIQASYPEVLARKGADIQALAKASGE